MLAPVMARCRPTRRGARDSSKVMPTSGHSPIPTSGMARTRSSRALTCCRMDIPSPPPMLIPCRWVSPGRAATVASTTYSCSNQSPAACGSSMAISRSRRTSAPAQNPRSPSPRISTRSAPAVPCCTASSIWVVSELMARGRVSVMWVRPCVRSMRMSSPTASVVGWVMTSLPHVVDDAHGCDGRDAMSRYDGCTT